MWSTLKINSGAQLGHDKWDIPAFDRVCLFVEGRGSRVTGRGSRVNSRGSRVTGRGSRVNSRGSRVRRGSH